MTEIVNLNRARKARNRAEAKAQADANRHLFGRTKLQRAQETARRTQIDRALDGAKRED